MLARFRARGHFSTSVAIWRLRSLSTTGLLISACNGAEYDKIDDWLTTCVLEYEGNRKLTLGVKLLDAASGRDLPFLKGHDDLDYSRKTASRFAMANICFDLRLVRYVNSLFLLCPGSRWNQRKAHAYRSYEQWVSLTRRETSADGVYLDRVSNRSARAMALDVISLSKI